MNTPLIDELQQLCKIPRHDLHISVRESDLRTLVNAHVLAAIERCAQVCLSEYVGESISATNISQEDAAYNTALIHASIAIRQLAKELT